jgi:hypothetical protein
MAGFDNSSDGAAAGDLFSKRQQVLRELELVETRRLQLETEAQQNLQQTQQLQSQLGALIGGPQTPAAPSAAAESSSTWNWLGGPQNPQTQTQNTNPPLLQSPASPSATEASSSWGWGEAAARSGAADAIQSSTASTLGVSSGLFQCATIYFFRSILSSSSASYCCDLIVVIICLLVL